jgi:hypothetical protein
MLTFKTLIVNRVFLEMVFDTMLINVNLQIAKPFRVRALQF